MGKARRSAFTVAEVGVAMAVFTLVLMLGLWVLDFSHRSGTRITAQVGLQQVTRKAVVRLLRELQEGMEVMVPLPGSTLPFALIRDKVSVVRHFYQTPGATPGTFELWRFSHDKTLPAAARSELLLTGVRRLTFTSRSEGALQVHLLVGEGDQEYSVLSTVRLRNLAAAEEIW